MHQMITHMLSQRKSYPCVHQETGKRMFTAALLILA